MHSTGAVGIAFAADASAKPNVEVEFPELGAIEDRLFTVTE